MSKIDALRARLSKLRGPARARPLLDLTQLLSDAYWQAGPGKPESRILLDQAIAAIDEAYGYFDAADPMRRNVAGMRGWLHGSRHLAHASPAEDRDIGLQQIEEGLRAPGLSPVLSSSMRLTQGQLYMSRVTGILQQPGAVSMITEGRLPATATTDVDRAVACFERVRDEAGAPHQARDITGPLLRMAGALRIFVTTPKGTSSVEIMNRWMEAMKVIQQIHQEQSAMHMVVPIGTNGAFYGADRIADQDPLDRPVPLVQSAPAVPRPRPAPRPTRTTSRVPAPVPAPNDATALRRELRELITGGGDLFPALDRLLRTPAPAPGLVDDMVALATAVVDAGAANRTDQLLLAAGLSLRARAAGGRRARRDLTEAADALVEAAGSARTPPPEAVRVMRRVADLVDQADPAIRAGHRLTAILREREGGR
ncbi:hypothetical protein GCM10010112_60160 [Actinoplanes lobatus]|uniref:Uncharacterized protein n=1 Tax=Actinoplanes lobatus TaxID=113568 RepID=A0A7W7MLP8_9ACTN|nr:hypothetical protein [Actinoplanes lobatus]MBB4754999.1 hypothetical protein [Actinoplanes lobatus]GGN82607.1 hypothetical protein GCM10010112_60160 [Actinoplanes lobatus]GIE40682.1 hypothetical protein Alo02nite_35800 [Actinoplanes lobatus]